MSDADVIIVGAGPAGVSAAFPLVEGGLRVLLVDAGKRVPTSLPRTDYITLRTTDDTQWKLLVGPRFEALRSTTADSPKFRVPTLVEVFDGYQETYRLRQVGFVARGSLTAGGLSNAWGAGVSCFDARDLKGFPSERSDLEPSYQSVARRIGISGVDDDDLAEFLGKGLPLQPPSELDPTAATLLKRYTSDPTWANARGVRLGRARNAVLTEPLGAREGCTYCSLCLYGCPRGSIYSAAFDLETLIRKPTFRYQPDVVIDAVEMEAGIRTVRGRRLSDGTLVRLSAPRIILACGAIGTAKLVLQALRLYDFPVRLLSLPMAVFAIWLPGRLGAAVARRSFGLSQLTFRVDAVSSSDDYAFGNFFSTAGLPVGEFARRAPLSRPGARGILRLLLPSMLVANCFLPGDLSAHRLTVHRDGGVTITGGFRQDLSHWIGDVRRRLAGALRRYGAVILPGSFTLASPGADLHYAGSVPQVLDPMAHQAHPSGEVAGLPGVFVVDASAFPRLPAKAHTFTVMANADRVARAMLRRRSA